MFRSTTLTSPSVTAFVIVMRYAASQEDTNSIKVLRDGQEMIYAEAVEAVN